MRMMNKTHKNRLAMLFASLLFAGLSLAALSGCYNGNDSTKKDVEAEEKIYTLQGTVELSNGERSATTSFAKLDNLSYKVTAYNTESEQYNQSNPIVAKLVEEEGNLKYTFDVKEAGTWTIVANAIVTLDDETKVVVMTNSKNWPVAENAVTVGVEKIVLNLQGYDTSTRGSIDLTIYDQTEKVQSVKMKATALIATGQSSEDSLKKQFDFSGTYKAGESERTATIQIDDVIPNCYEVTFDFYDNKDRVLYSCKEAITVFGGYKTDKWVNSTDSNNSHLVYDSDLEETKFVISNQLLQGYNQAGDLNYPIVLWNKREEEYTHTEIDDSGYMYTTFDNNFTLGIQAFGKITDETNITCNDDYIPYNEEGNPVFCFDNNAKVSIYTLDNRYIYRYKQSYAGYKFDEDFEIDLEELLSDAGVTSGQFQKSYTGIAFCNPYLFFFFKLDDNNVYIGAVDPEVTSDFMCGVLQNDSNNLFSVTSMAVDSIEMDGGDNKTILCYSGDSTYSDNQSLYIKALEFNGSSISLDSSINGALTSDMGTGLDFAKITDRAIISDLYIWDNVLYVALCSYYMNSGSDTVYPYSNSYFEDAGEYYRRPIFVSNGGIAKVNLSNPDNEGDYEFADWSKLVEQGKYLTKVLGWKETTYYEFDEAANTYTLETDGTEARHVTIAPPLNESDQYFYGARKFIARKPDELVIADDGGYVDIDLDDSGNPKEGTLRSSENMNRVVTVDLKKEAITSVEDVNACFTLTFDTFNPGDSTFYGYGLKIF